MSFDAMRWAMGVRAPNSAGKLLLVALADLVRPPTMRAYASASRLSATTQLDRKTVLATLKKLENARLIVRLPERAGVGGAPVFELLMLGESGAETGTACASASAPKSGTAPTESGTESGITSTPGEMNSSNGSGTGLPAKSSQISVEVVPVSGHKPVRTSFEPVKKKKGAVGASLPSPDGTSLLPDVRPEALRDWEVVRKAKRAGAITTTVARILRREAEKAGLTPQQAVEYCCGRAWQNFDAEWYARATGPTKSASASGTHAGFAGKNYRQGVMADGSLA